MDSSQPSAIVCHRLTKSFRVGSNQVHALRGIDLSVGAGELLMLVGPSGCGKTTLLSVIAGTLDADAGQCLLWGQDITRMHGSKKTRFRGKHIGFVFQAFNLLPMLTALQNVATPLLIAGCSWRESMRRSSIALAMVGLESKLQSRPTQLSGGQQQRVAIARAIVHDPPLVICDEPTSALDHDTGQSIMELLRRVTKANQRTVVVVTHDSRIFSYADRIVAMDDGRTVSEPTETSGP
jgi:putative ABC transport system ATP-binding protein